MSKDSDFQPSRRQLLSQGVNASLGFILLPQFLGGGGKILERQSLRTLATTPGQVLASKPLGQNPITVTIHFIAKANQAEALVNQLTLALADAREAPGCRYAQVYTILDNPNQVVLFKGWDHRDAQETYLKWEQSSGRLAKLLALVEGDPVVEYWEFQAT